MYVFLGKLLIESADSYMKTLGAAFQFIAWEKMCVRGESKLAFHKLLLEMSWLKN